MSRTTIQLPTEGSGPHLDAEQLTIAGQIVKRQSVESCPPRRIVQASVTRPANTTAYAAGDALTNSTSAPVVLTFENMARFPGGGGIVRVAHLLDSAAQATKISAELWLFAGAAAPTPDNDNVPFTPTDAELANLIGVIVFDGLTAGWVFVGDVTAGAGGNAVIIGRIGPSGAGGHLLDLPYVCGPATTSLWGLLVVRNAYTPVSGEVFTVSLLNEPQ